MEPIILASRVYGPWRQSDTYFPDFARPRRVGGDDLPPTSPNGREAHREDPMVGQHPIERRGLRAPWQVRGRAAYEAGDTTSRGVVSHHRGGGPGRCPLHLGRRGSRSMPGRRVAGSDASWCPQRRGAHEMGAMSHRCRGSGAGSPATASRRRRGRRRPRKRDRWSRFAFLPVPTDSHGCPWAPAATSYQFSQCVSQQLLRAGGG